MGLLGGLDLGDVKRARGEEKRRIGCCGGLLFLKELPVDTRHKENRQMCACMRGITYCLSLKLFTDWCVGLAVTVK